ETDMADLDNFDSAKAIAESIGIHVEKSWGLGRIVTEIFDEVAAPYRKVNCSFFDFEHYPKFQFNENKNYSSFIKALLDNLTRDDD
ncbi:hypothetical protein MJM04_29125, partial [Salmonella enterica subsp. enterica serovar Cerro]|nr:hypothetical protein [Salmonella enterica subsp. enterica serovar Cerro]